MKSTLRGFLCISLLLSVATVHAESNTRSCNTCQVSSCDVSQASCNTCSAGDNGEDSVYCKSHFLPRSQGEHRNRDYVGQAHLQNLADKDDWNWVFSAALAYSQNFKRHELGEFFSPHADSNSFTVGPDNTTDVDVRNVDLGLSPTFEGTLTLNPRIRNIIFEPSFYLGLDRWIEGGWLWLKLPVVHTRWALQCEECITNSGGEFFAPGFMSISDTPVAVNVTSIQDAFSGTKTWGGKTVALSNARMICCEAEKTGVADIPLHLGYNFIAKEKGCFGAYVRTVFPTGRTHNRNSIWDPRVGWNRWQLGGGIQGNLRIYEKDEDTSIAGYLDFYTTHPFSKKECRVFDLKANGCFSRYLLLKEFDSADNLTGNLFNVADKFNLNVESTFNWSLEGTFLFELKHKGWTADLGYNVWARDEEHFNCDCLSICVPAATSCDASCNTSCNASCNTSCDTSAASCNSANPLGTNRYGIKGLTNASTANTASLSTIAVAATADATPTFIDATNYRSAFDLDGNHVPRGVSHTVFAHAGYTCEDRDYPLFIGVGGEAEFGNGNKALHAWSVWAKAGIAYN
jgi:hypothetical protein